MTDINDLRRKARAAREIHVTVGEAQFTLLLPTQHEVEVEALRTRVHNAESHSAHSAVLTRRLLERAVVAWSGVTCEQLAPHGGSDAAELVPGAVELLLDNDLPTARVLLDRFMEAFNERHNQRSTAAKN